MEIKRNLFQTFLHLTFHISILLKGFYASIETATGIALFFVAPTFITDSIILFTQNILYKNPDNIFALYIHSAIQDFTSTTQHLIALYFIIHGGVKLCVVIGILLKKLWAYPAAIMIFSIFFLYLITRYFSVHAPFLLILALFEVIVVLLTWNEYVTVKKDRAFLVKH